MLIVLLFAFKFVVIRNWFLYLYTVRSGWQILFYFFLFLCYHTQLFQHHSLREEHCLFPHWSAVSPLSKIKCSCLMGLFLDSIFFHWFICLALPQDLTMLITAALWVRMSGKQILSPCFSSLSVLNILSPLHFFFFSSFYFYLHLFYAEFTPGP